MNTNIKISTNKEINGLKVAFATNDMQNIDAHFGSCQKFAVYDVSKEDNQMSGIIHTKEEKDKEGDKTANIINALKGIDIVYFLDIGPIAAATTAAHPRKRSDSQGSPTGTHIAESTPS